MHRRSLARSLLQAAMMGSLFLAGCAGPRVITSVTQRGDKLKFVYYQDKGTSLEKGAVLCKAAADGTLTDCQTMQIVFKE